MTDREINIIQDHACIVHFIDSLSTAIENNDDLPNFVPVLNDTLVTDQLSMIAETICKLRDRKK